MRHPTLLALSGWLLAAWPAAAETADFAAWLEEVRAEALERGISASTLETAFFGLQPIPRVIELDRSQPESVLSFDEYMARVVTDSRVEQGRDELRRYGELLEEVRERYGVEPRFIVALWGIETNYGRHSGSFPVVAALATLAHDGRRSRFFRKELFYSLEILDQKHIEIDRMMGSWAGAMGQNQFMPSSFVNFAVDFDGDGRRDIWTTEADVFASAANYLSQYGWKDEETWGREVRIPAGFEASRAGLEIVKPLAEWRALGLGWAAGGELPLRDLEASLIQPGGEEGPAFLVYDNFRAILTWNRSLYFGVAVGRLADRIGAD